MEKKTRWCERCHVPLIGPLCGICKTEGIPFNSKCKPVFREELDLCQNLPTGKKLTIAPENFLFKSRSNIYGLNGTTYKLQIKHNTELEIVSAVKEKTPKKTGYVDLASYAKIAKQSTKGKHQGKPKPKVFIDKWDGTTDYEKSIVQANLSYLQALEKEAVEFIQGALKDYPEEEYLRFISFSGGKDSTVTAFLVNQATEKTRYPLIFSNTTIEFDDTVKFNHDFVAKYGNELIELKGDRNFFDTCEKLGPPSRMMRWCCSTQKSAPINQFQWQLQKPIVSFDGIRRDESKLRSSYKRIQKNTKVTKQISVYPIIDWTELDVWLYLLWRKIPFNPMYRNGFARIGCWPCPNNGKMDWIYAKYFVPEFPKLENLLLDFGKTHGKDEEWVYSGKWKARKVHYQFEQKIKKSHACLQGNDVFYTLEHPIPNLSEFLKVFGDCKLIDEDGQMFILDGKYCKGTFSQQEHFVKVEFDTKTLPGHFKFQFERQLTKATNCINCGGCAGTCPHGAIKFTPNFTIDENKCIRCRICVGSRYLGMGCVALHYKAEQDKIENAFKYNHAVPGDFYKHAYGFSSQLYQKLKQIGLLNVDEFLKKDVEYLIEKTGLSAKKIRAQQKIIQSHVEHKILPFHDESIEEIRKLSSLPLIYLGIRQTTKDSNPEETATQLIVQTESKEGIEIIDISSPEEMEKFEELIATFNNNFRCIYFESNPTKNRLIKDILKTNFGIKGAQVFDFYRFILNNFAVPMKKSGNNRLEQILNLLGIEAENAHELGIEQLNLAIQQLNMILG
jgi:phosphoadenosine phosphosulfate reductase